MVKAEAAAAVDAVGIVESVVNSDDDDVAVVVNEDKSEFIEPIDRTPSDDDVEEDAHRESITITPRDANAIHDCNDDWMGAATPASTGTVNCTTGRDCP